MNSLTFSQKGFRYTVFIFILSHNLWSHSFLWHVVLALYFRVALDIVCRMRRSFAKPEMPIKFSSML